MFTRFKKILRLNPVLKGLPVFGICFGGLYAITVFQEGRFERVDFMIKSQTETAYNLEAELETVLRGMDLSDYKPIPIPGANGESRVKVEEEEED
jgi:hypothetical protein